MSSRLDLWDYRRRVEEIYQRVRGGGAGSQTWEHWRSDRDRLFAEHPQSPITDPDLFSGLPYYSYDPEWRTTARFAPGSGDSLLAGHSGEGSTGFINLGRLEFEVKGHRETLDLLWLDSYGGGVFLPFRDSTNGSGTYGGGRYLLDSAKGADLGHDGNEVILDFNYAYHPSCVHSDRWSCPLAPTQNRLSVAVVAGERLAVQSEQQ